MSEANNLIELSHPAEDNFANSLLTTCAELFAKNLLVDCTLSCMDGSLQVHRVVLASASGYLNNLLSSTPLPSPCSHPMLFLRNSTLYDTKCAMEFIYTGKIQVNPNKLSALVEISEELGLVSFSKAIENAMKKRARVGPTQRESSSDANTTNGRQVNNNININSNNSRNSEEFETSPLAQDEDMESDNENEDSDSSPPLIGIVKTEMITEEPESEAAGFDFSNSVINGKATNSDATQKSMKSSYDTLKRVTASLFENSPKQKLSRMVNPLKHESFNNNGISSENQNGQISNFNKNSTTLQLQHDKGEQFVYTNADFGMKSEPDDNESGGDDTSDIPSQQMPLLNLSDLFKGEMKPGDEVLINEVPGSCPWCMQVFTNLALLQKHIRSHVGNYRPFKCEYCQNSFARSAHLKRHLRTHTGEKPYTCTICNRPFARQDKLKSHLERHLHNANKNPTNNMTITSYPPVSLSQSSGGQVPIKVILPVGKGSSAMKNFYTNNNSNNLNNIIPNRFANSNNISGNNGNGLSISYATSTAEQSRSSVSGGDLTVTPANIPSSTTITPIVPGNGGITFSSGDPNKRSKSTLNFLVK